MSKRLTDKQEKFAQLVVKYSNQSKAYREAYDVKEGTTDKSVSEQASTLANDLTVSSRIEEIRKEARDISKIDRQWIIDKHRVILDWYEELRELAKKTDLDKEEKSRIYMLKDLIKGSDYRGSLDSVTKMLGLNEPEKIDKEIKIEIVEKKRD